MFAQLGPRLVAQADEAVVAVDADEHDEGEDGDDDPEPGHGAAL